MWPERKRLDLGVVIAFVVLVLAFAGDDASQAAPTANTGDNIGPQNVPADVPQIHIIAHTHDDVGWKKTVDEYYYGSNQTIANGAVQYVLDSVITALVADPKKKFSYVEMAFFYRWWREQDEDRQEQVRTLLKNGQLEFVGGGWCMNDEAGAHYNAIIDQITFGNLFIHNVFGPEYRPRMAWQIDPFGHSSVQAAIFSQMGYDGLYFARADYEDKGLRINQSRLELVWRGSPDNLGPQSDLFTGMFYAGYGSNGEFNFDARSANPQVVRDDVLLEDFNVHTLVNDFVALVTNQLKAYRTNHLLFPMGGDFTFAAALSHFKNIDKLMKYVNADGRVNVFYSTPSRYLDAVNAEGLAWELKTDDFFPYADRPHGYWTGYFTSRPALKRYVRDQNALLQICKQIETVHGRAPSGSDSFGLREAMSVAQHHDAVSGTEQQHVAYDYAKRLAVRGAECYEVIASHVSSLLGLPSPHAGDEVGDEFGMTFCTELNVSLCNISSTSPFTMTLYNPLAHARTSKTKIPVMQKAYDVTGDAVISHGVVLVSDGAAHARGKRGDAPYELIILTSLPPTSLATVTIKPSLHKDTDSELLHSPAATQEKLLEKSKLEAGPSISNEFYAVNFSATTGGIVSITEKTTGHQISLEQSFLWYESYNNTKNHDQASGAYIFRSKGDSAYPVSADGTCKLELVQEGVLEEVRQKCGDFVYQRISLYKGFNHIEFTFTVGPIPIADHKGKEVVSRFSSDLKTAGIFYTDANGREMQKRQRDHRNTWHPNMTVFEHVAGNFYPVNSRIALRDMDKGVQLSILTDSSQAGASLVDGSAELMVHRRLLVDDNRGVNEPLNETGLDGKGLIVQGTHYVQLAPIQTAASLHRPLAQEVMLPALPMFAGGAAPKKPTISKLHPQNSATPVSLPANVHLLTLERIAFDPKSNGSVQRLVRFEHYFEVDEDSELSKPATVNVQEYLQSSFGISIISMVEMTLNANQEKSQEKRLQWKVSGEDTTSSTPKLNRSETNNAHHITRRSPDDFEITLYPMDIRTYIVTVQ